MKQESYNESKRGRMLTLNENWIIIVVKPGPKKSKNMNVAAIT